MKCQVLAMLLLSILLGGGCQQQDTPTPAQLEGKWNLAQYVITEFTRYGSSQSHTIIEKPNIFLVISAHTIEYNDPALSNPIAMPYTRQDTKLTVGQSPSQSQLQTIQQLTAHALVLHVVLPGAVVGDSTFYDYAYTR